MSNWAVREALSSHLLTLNLSPAVELLWENSYDATPETTHLLAQLVPLRTVRTTVNTNAPSEHVGQFQISVVTVLGKGAKVSDEIGDQIVAHFSKDLQLPAVNPVLRITDTPMIQSGYESGSWWMVPVMVPYLAYF